MRRFFTGLVVLLLAANARAASLQARLIRASDSFDATDAALNDLEPKLKREFGFNFYHLLGCQQATLDQKIKSRLDLGEGFVLFVTPHPSAWRAHEVELEWWSGNTLLVKTVARVPGKCSVLIKGPGVGEDWIILALSGRE
jgi:hypothetical protein